MGQIKRLFDWGQSGPDRADWKTRGPYGIGNWLKRYHLKIFVFLALVAMLSS